MVSGTRRKRFTLVVLSAAVLSAAFVARAVGEPPAAWVRDGDRAAAAFADTEVLPYVQLLAATESDPAAAIATFLASPEDDLGPLHPFHISLLSAHDGTFAVAFYRHVESSGLPLGGGDYWGRSCREYTAEGDRGVAVAAVECDADVPESPYTAD